MDQIDIILFTENNQMPRALCLTVLLYDKAVLEVCPLEVWH